MLSRSKTETAEDQKQHSLFATENYRELELKISAFKKIYRALWRAQENSEIVKTNFLLGKETMSAHQFAEEIENHYKEAPHSRTAQAWKLAIKYYEQCHADNPELFNAIYQYAHNNTHHFGLKFFSRPKARTFTPEDISERVHTSERIGFLIAFELEWSAKNYEIREVPPSIKVMA